MAVSAALPVVLRRVHHRGELLRHRRDLKVLHVAFHGGVAEGRGLAADRPGHAVPHGRLSHGDTLAMALDNPSSKRLNYKQDCARHTLVCLSRPTPRQSRGPSTHKKYR